MIQQNYLGVVVKDLEAATKFYQDTLGLDVNEQESIPGQYTQFHLNGDSVLSLQAQTEIPGGQPFEPAMQVEDADGCYTTWQERGVEMLSAPQDYPFGRSFLFRTPEGQVFRAFQPQG